MSERSELISEIFGDITYIDDSDCVGLGPEDLVKLGSD